MNPTLNTLLTNFRTKRAALFDPPSLFDEDFIHRFTYHSNAIEGNSLSLAETKQLLTEGSEIVGKSQHDHIEAIGHRDASVYMEQLSRRPKPISLQTMKELHSLVLFHHAERGKFRSSPVSIKGSLHQPASPFMVQSMCFC